MDPQQGNANDSTPRMTTLSEAMDYATRQGFTRNFIISESGLTWDDGEKAYGPEDVRVVNYYRFEGYSDPDDNEILYLIETRGGEKGTLTEAYGAYADDFTSAFIARVEGISKVQH